VRTEITTHSEAETSAVGRDLATTLEAGSVVLLYGDLGAGKTALVRGLAEGLGAQGHEVTSPTFTLLQEYRGGRLPLVHVDLYRLNDPREIEELGLDEIGADGVAAIEWGEKFPRPLRGAIGVRIRHGKGDIRVIEITSPAPPTPT
jgi:tRNA threonylcarbamoyladenosine biosynthesis protein TsaE